MDGPSVISWSLAPGGQPQAVARLVRCDFRLPGRLCPVCQEREIHLELARFDLPIPSDVKPRAIQRIHTLSPEGFSLLVRSITPDPELQAELLPGTKLGKPIFSVPSRPIDVVWVGLLLPLLSEQAVETFRSRNVEVNVFEVEIAPQRKKTPRFFGLIPKICEVLDAEWLSQEMIQCAVCQQWRVRPEIRVRKSVFHINAHVSASRWPDSCSIVYSPSLMTLFYSPAFVRAFQDADLLGAEFKQVNWV